MRRHVRIPMVALLAIGLLVTGASLAYAEQSAGCEKTCAKCATCPKHKEGFKTLFDGKTLKGWTGDTKLWSVKGGMLIGRAAGIKKNQFLCTTDQFEDFVWLRRTGLILGSRFVRHGLPHRVGGGRSLLLCGRLVG